MSYYIELCHSYIFVIHSRGSSAFSFHKLGYKIYSEQCVTYFEKKK